MVAERNKQTRHIALREMKVELAGRGVSVSRDAVWTLLQREGFQFKTLFVQSRQAGLGPHRLVFSDATWIRANMAPLRGPGREGQVRCRLYSPTAIGAR